MPTPGELNRRTFLNRVAALGGAGATAAVAGPGLTPPALGAGPASRPKPQAQTGGHPAVTLNRVVGGDFQDFVGHTFVIQNGTRAGAPVELAHVLEVPPKADAAEWPNDRPPFSLIFRALGGRRLTQGTYAIQNQDIGTFQLFLVPVGHPRHGLKYEAVFG